MLLKINDADNFRRTLAGLALIAAPLVFGSADLIRVSVEGGVVLRSGAWLLIVGGFPGIILMTVSFGHLSAGLLLLYIAWAVLGYALWSEWGIPAAQRHVEESV